MMYWLVVRTCEEKPRRASPDVASLIDLGLLEETGPPHADCSAYYWLLSITQEGKKVFEDLDPVVKANAWIRCGALYEAEEIIEVLPVDRLAEFLVCKNYEVREAARGRLEDTTKF